MLTAVQTAHEEELTAYLSFDLALKMEGLDRSGTFAVCILIGLFDLLADCRPLLPLVQLGHAFRQDVDSWFLQDCSWSTALMLIDEVMGGFASDEEVEAIGSDPE